MFRTLYSRLAMTLFVLLCLVGLILMQMINHSTTLYQQEVSQKLNIKLAQHIVSEQPLMIGDEVNEAILDDLFHNLMVINPSIELYILNRTGKVLGYFAPEGKVKRVNISLTPVLDYIKGGARLPLKGDDPRNPDGQKVFSAAEIKDTNGLQGYLYIVLGGEEYDNVVQMLGNSHSLDLAMLVLMVALLTALLGGLIVFALQTRRLRKLSHVIRNYAGHRGSQKQGVTPRYTCAVNSNDEIDELGIQFNQMADQINHQIEELQRMDSLRREMVANVSHDLRTPLTTLRGYLETLLLKSNELSEIEQQQYIETALAHSVHLGNLVDELFELARLDSCESAVYSEPFSMCELVQDVTQKYSLLAEQSSIELDINLNLNTPMVYGDIAMMQRVLENLLDNGVRHTPAGGRIHVSVDVESANVVVQVSDNGAGIPAEDVPRIFERFYQRESSRGDSGSAGLGLAIAQRILELHNSVIKVKSELHHGTTFTFQLATRHAS